VALDADQQNNPSPERFIAGNKALAGTGHDVIILGAAWMV